MNKEQGCIDGMAGGVVRGWVYNSDNPNSQRKFFLEVNGELVGCFTAKIHRVDLENAGFGDGRHGFEIDSGFDDGSGISFAMRLLDENQEPIPSAQWTTPLITTRVNIKQVRINRYSISFQIFCETAINNRHWTLFANGKSVNRYTLNLAEGLNDIAINIPAQLIHGQEQKLNLNMEGFCGSLWQGICKFSPSYLPIEQLYNVEKSVGKIGLSNKAQSRYESILKAIESYQSPQLLQKIHSAHQYLLNSIDNTQHLEFLEAVKLSHLDPLRFSLIIYGSDNFQSVLKTIASCVLGSQNTNYEIIVVANLDTEGQNILLQHNIKLVDSSSTSSVTKKINIAMEQAICDVCVLAVSGTEFCNEAGILLVDNLQKVDSLAIASPKIVDQYGFLHNAGLVVWNNSSYSYVGWQDSPHKPEYNFTRDITACSEQMFAIKKDMWVSLGKFSDTHDVFSDALIDMCFKANEKSQSVKYFPNAIAFIGEEHTTIDSMNQIITNQQDFENDWQTKLSQHPTPLVDLHLNKDYGVDKRILVIDHSTPIIGQDAGSYAALQEIKLLIGLGYKVTYLPRNLLDLGSPTADLQDLGVEVLFAPFYASTQSAISNRIDEMDAVYITRYEVAEHFIPLIRNKRSDIPIIFNNADFHYLRELRQAELENDDILKKKALETKSRELAVMEQCDILLSYTKEEGELIKSLITRPERVFHCPWVVEHNVTTKTFEDRTGIAFLGGYRHSPNVDAVKWFANQIMPKLSELDPKIAFYVYGSHMPDEFNSLASDNLVIKGHAQNLYEVYNNHRIFVCPLNFGAGIKGKLIDSLAFGLPVISSSMAAEGVGIENGKDALICNNIEDWVSSILSLYANQSSWTDLRNNGLRLAHQQYSKEAGYSRFNEIFQYLGLDKQ